jgi:asparaginyl-tRNA synthetase
MAPWVYVEDIARHVGESVRVRGWVHHSRSSGKIAFVVVRDGTGLVQVVATIGDLEDERFRRLGSLSQESSLEVTGKVRADPRSPGGYEISLEDFQVLHETDGYPITPKSHGATFLLDHRHLWLRSRRQQIVMRVRAQVIRSIRRFLDDRGFLNLDTPIFTPNACEGTTTLFETDYFGDKAYLTQSGQLYNEATAAAFGKVYCFGPTFRAEKSKTRRHLTEFWMVEPEVAYAGLDDIMVLAEEMVSYVVEQVLDALGPQLEDVLERDLGALREVRPPFPRIHYKEACDLLAAEGSDFTPGGDFGAADETLISSKFPRPVFVHHFPTSVKAFYMEPDPREPEYCLSVDLLAPEGYGEIIGGGQRIADLKTLEEKLESHDLPREDFEWYLDLRRYGSVPHSGFGLGVERTVAWLCGIKHLREAIPFPRQIHRLHP